MKNHLRTAISMFDGIGTIWLVLKELGVTYDNGFAYEKDKYASSICEKHFPYILNLGELGQRNFKHFHKVDFVCGGFPCTDLSIAKNYRQGLKGNASSLFWELVRCIDATNPKSFLVENVASMSDKDCNIISKELGVEPILINSALVSAQQRKRLYWTNILDVQQPKDKRIYLSSIIESGYTWLDKSFCIDANYYKKGILNYFTSQAGLRFMVLDKPSSAKHIEEANFAIEKYKINLPLNKYGVRVLTPVECERLQTLPDNYTAGISNAQRYKCLGNGWTKDVIKHILSYQFK